MLCPKCQRELPPDAVICCYCGKKISADKRKKTKRPNGTGYVYPRNATWTARVVDHYDVITEGDKRRLRPVYKTKGGFKTKRDAINHVSTLLASVRNEHPPKTFQEDFDAWKERYADRIAEKTMSDYGSAFKHYKKFHHKNVDTISTTDLQSCIDSCGHGKRTKEQMKTVASLVYKYAIDDNQTLKNPAANLYTGDDETQHYEALTEEELKKVEDSGLEYADYIVALCYLGHRPSEFFGFTKEDYHEENGTHYLYGGVKTKAGKTRSVTIPPHVLPIIQRRLAVEGTDLLFPRYDRRRNGKPKGFSQMPVRYFNKFIWKPIMEKLGIVGKVPYSTRHTYANKMKKADGDEKDKAALMGHASYETTRKYYQSTSLPEAKAITDQMK